MAYSSGAKHLVREAVVWLSVAALGFSGVYFFDDLRRFTTKTIASVASSPETALLDRVSEPKEDSGGFERSVTLKADDSGHFFTRAYVNGQPIAVVVDTGATVIALSYEDADRIGLRPRDSDYTHATRTANGIARAAPVALDSVRIGGVEVKNLRGSIAEPGKQHVTLLGMEFIRRLNRFELRGRELVLVE